jgi:hypothetical protein
VLVRKAIELAKGGDVPMLKFLLGRILPQDRRIKIDLPHTIYSDEDTAHAIARVIAAVADGQISPSEGAAIVNLMECYRRAADQSHITDQMDELKSKLILKGN